MLICSWRRLSSGALSLVLRHCRGVKQPWLNPKCRRRLQEIATQVSAVQPNSAEGITVLESPTFVLHAFKTVTGTLFFLTADPHTPNLHTILRQTYVIYCDFVLKNPFHQADMPIRSELFELNLSALVQRIQAA